jgi:hypothetical protein
VRLVEDLDLPVALMDRPWNREVGHLPRRILDRMVRCRDWQDVARVLDPGALQNRRG